MNPIAAIQSLLMPTLVGICLFFFFFGWKRLSARWSNWFPALKFIAEYGMYGIGLGIIALAAYAFMGSMDWRISAFGLFLGLAGAWISSILLTPEESEEVERGARIEEAKVIAKATAKLAPPYPIVFGGVKLPSDAEPYHLLIAGSTGSGKSVAIKGVLDSLRRRGDTVILVDSGGEFMARYWDAEKDYILNPYDHRCVAWSPMSELAGEWDCDSLAKSIVPDGVGDSKEWNNYAQTLVGSVMQSLLRRGDLSLKSMLMAIQTTEIEDLTELLAGTPAYSQLASDKMFGSIRTIASNYLAVYNKLADEVSTFSITKFIQNGRGGFLYLTYRDDQLDSLKNLIALTLDVASRTILSLKPDDKRRVWLVIDEFASIGKVQSIEAVATKARKAGGCLLVGLQSVSQLQDRYGDKAAQSILSCLSTWLVLRCGDADTADYMSRYLGDEQVKQTLANTSNADSGKSVSMNASIQTRRIVMAPQIQQLKNCVGFLRITGGYPVCSVSLSFPEKRKDAIETFVMRDFRTRPCVDLAAASKVAPMASAEGRVIQSPQNAPRENQNTSGFFTRRVAELQSAYEAESNGEGNPEKLVGILGELQGLQQQMQRVC